MLKARRRRAGCKKHNTHTGAAHAVACPKIGGGGAAQPAAGSLKPPLPQPPALPPAGAVQKGRASLLQAPPAS